MRLTGLLGVFVAGMAFLHQANAGLWIDRSLVNTGDTLTIKVVHPQSTGVRGDVYVFFLLPGQRIADAVPKDGDGNPAPSLRNVDLGQSQTVLSVVVPPGLAPGRYFLVEIVTVPGGDPRNLDDWIEGVGAFDRVLFFLDDPVVGVYDRDGDRFFDDDADHDGFHDVLDKNYDGYYDDDADHDGYHDDDADRDGYHDDDLNHDGFHDDDSDRDGYHDDDSNLDGQHDDSGGESDGEGVHSESHSSSEAHG
ncbi:MAG TPA: hypothetical protein ENK50_09590 [Sedimenticola sp.]|nr:hypothetical protein [Sedimenticola sp.]